MERARRPWSALLDGVEAGGEPLVGQVTEEGEVGRGPLVESWGGFGAVGTRLLEPKDQARFIWSQDLLGPRALAFSPTLRWEVVEEISQTWPA